LVVEWAVGLPSFGVLLLAGCFVGGSCRVAGYEMDLGVYHHLRAVHHLLVGELTAERVTIRAV